ncbi:hypothetical protein Tco_0753757 [Tanacetum coccineum]
MASPRSWTTSQYTDRENRLVEDDGLTASGNPSDVRSISRIKSSSRHEVTIPNPVFRCSEFGGVTDWKREQQTHNRKAVKARLVKEAATGHSIPRRIDLPTSQATQLPELGLTLTPATGREHSQEINNLNVPALISQASGPSRKRSRSPSSPFFPDAITFFDGKPASKTSELNPEDVTARLDDLEVEVDTLHADTKDKELLISELQDSLAAAENEIALLQIRVTNAEDRHAEDHEQIQKILARLSL